jgi:hypothetical protein
MQQEHLNRLREVQQRPQQERVSGVVAGNAAVQGVRRSEAGARPRIRNG